MTQCQKLTASIYFLSVKNRLIKSSAQIEGEGLPDLPKQDRFPVGKGVGVGILAGGALANILGRGAFRQHFAPDKAKALERFLVGLGAKPMREIPENIFKVPIPEMPKWLVGKNWPKELPIKNPKELMWLARALGQEATAGLATPLGVVPGGLAGGVTSLFYE